MGGPNPRSSVHRRVRWGLTLATIMLAVTPPAAAEQKDLYERLWPRVPDGQRATMSEQLMDELTELGNLLGYHANVLSHDMFALEVDARRKRAYLAVGGGDDRYLTFRLASDIQFTEGLARVNTRVDLSFHGRKLELHVSPRADRP